MLIETLPAAFQMEEILYELKEHSSGLNCGRWDYIFSLSVVLFFLSKGKADGQYQDAESEQKCGDAGSRTGQYDCSVHGCLCSAAHSDMSQVSSLVHWAESS